MKLLGLTGIAFCALALGQTSTQAAITLDFEGLGNNQGVTGYYNGSPGPGYGVTFSPNATSYISQDYGGTGPFRNNPSGKTIVYFTDDSTPALMTVPAGFTGTLSFYYSTPFTPGGPIKIYSGLNGSGDLLKSFTLISTPPTILFYDNWAFIDVAFDGVAKSIDFSGVRGYVAFDDIAINTTSQVTPVPEASTWLAGLGCLLPFVGAAVRRFRK